MDKAGDDESFAAANRFATWHCRRYHVQAEYLPAIIVLNIELNFTGLNLKIILRQHVS
jgi:hypothetical protein